MIASWRKYNERLARLNKDVAHDRPSQEDPTIRRNSFFRGENMVEADSAALVARHSPFVILGDLPGNASGQPYAPQRKIKPTIFFLATTDDSADTIEAVKELTFSIMQQFLAAYIADSEKGCCCGPIGHFKYTSASWQETGPRLTRDYGWELALEFTQPAPELIYNPSNWLPDDNS